MLDEFGLGLSGFCESWMLFFLANFCKQFCFSLSGWPKFIGVVVLVGVMELLVLGDVIEWLVLPVRISRSSIAALSS